MANRMAEWMADMMDMTMVGPWDIPMVESRASTTVVLTATTMDMTMAVSTAG